MKSSPAESRITVTNRVRTAWDVFQGFRKKTLGTANASKEIEWHRRILDDFRRYGASPIEGARYLEVGCGQQGPQLLLFAADGMEAEGIDLTVSTLHFGPATLLQILRNDGPERALKTLVRHYLFDGRYYREMAEEYGKALPFARVRTHLMSATAMTYPDNSFDYIGSRSVFEHIDDVTKAVQEVDRVLKPGGIAWIGIHLFPSLTGGHHIEWLDPGNSKPKRTPPWDHLRENKYPAVWHLNKLRLADYQRVFVENISVLEERRMTEFTDKPLTPEIERELAAKGYAREELLTRAAFFICTKKTVSQP